MSCGLWLGDPQFRCQVTYGTLNRAWRNNLVREVDFIPTCLRTLHFLPVCLFGFLSLSLLYLVLPQRSLRSRQSFAIPSGPWIHHRHWLNAENTIYFHTAGTKVHCVSKAFENWGFLLRNHPVLSGKLCCGGYNYYAMRLLSWFNKLVLFINNSVTTRHESAGRFLFSHRLMWLVSAMFCRCATIHWGSRTLS